MAMLSQLAARHQQIQKAMPRRAAPVVDGQKLGAAQAARAMAHASGMGHAPQFLIPPSPLRPAVSHAAPAAPVGRAPDGVNTMAQQQEMWARWLRLFQGWTAQSGNI